MTRTTLLRGAAVALVSLTFGCGDSTGPNTRLSETQLNEMLDAMSAVSALAALPVPGMGTGGSSALRAANVPMANATVTVSETVDCPISGSATVNGTVTDDQATNSMTAQVTQTYNDCAATSSEGRTWTFNGNPNIVTNLSASSNESTGAFSLTMSQVGGISFASDVATGSCQINLTLTMTGTQQSLSMNLSGSACGRNVSQSIEVTQ